MTTVRTWVLVPMKRFAQAKSRLQEQLSPDARRTLARALFVRVLGAAQRGVGVAGTAVVTNGDDVAELAERAGVHVLRDAALEQPTLGRLLDAALHELPRLGATRAIVLMGDLPQIEAGDVSELAAALDDVDVAISPDRHGRSTNALAVHLPFPLATAFGDPSSYGLHVRSAREHGLRVLTLVNARLGHDVDTRLDLPLDAAGWAAVLRGDTSWLT
jgi:2-phospho-L-lactate guanylyltransferase